MFHFSPSTPPDFSRVLPAFLTVLLSVSCPPALFRKLFLFPTSLYLLPLLFSMSAFFLFIGNLFSHQNPIPVSLSCSAPPFDNDTIFTVSCWIRSLLSLSWKCVCTGCDKNESMPGPVFILVNECSAWLYIFTKKQHLFGLRRSHGIIQLCDQEDTCT